MSARAERERGMMYAAQELNATRELVRRFVAWSDGRDAHTARGYVLHEEHARVVLASDQERLAIVAAAKALLGSGD